MAASGAHMPALATPSRAIGSSSCQNATLGVMSRLTQNSEIEQSSIPLAVM